MKRRRMNKNLYELLFDKNKLSNIKIDNDSGVEELKRKFSVRGKFF